VKRNFYLSDGLKRFFFVNRKFVLIILIVMLIGVLTGVFCCAKTSITINIYYVQNIALRLIIIDKLSFIGFIFLSLLFYFILLFLIFFLSFFRFGSFFIFCILAYLCYCFGVDMSVVFISFGSLKGIFISFGAILPFYSVTIFIFFVYSFKMIGFNKQFSICGNYEIKRYELRILFSYFLILSIIIFFQGITLFVVTKIFVF